MIYFVIGLTILFFLLVRKSFNRIDTLEKQVAHGKVGWALANERTAQLDKLLDHLEPDITLPDALSQKWYVSKEDS
jgi:hypothetical protein